MLVAQRRFPSVEKRPPIRSVKVWDPGVRLFHWGTALLFFANLTIFEDDSPAHIYAGYVLFALVLIRLLWGLIGTKYARFSAFRPSLSEIRAHLKGLLSGQRELHVSHNPLGALMVYNLLVTLVLISITGIMMTTDAFWGVDWVEELHELLANYALFCVGLHIAGVLLETKRSEVNLIKAMVTGRKEIPYGGSQRCRAHGQE
jgi:cytochrome b